MGEIISFDNGSLDAKLKRKEIEAAAIKYAETRDMLDYSNFEVLYYEKELEYQVIIQKTQDPEQRRYLGHGFPLALAEFKGSKVTLDVIAEFMLNDIYEESSEYNLEATLHKEFNTKEAFLNFGIRKYIINSVMAFDECLAGYLQANPEIMSGLEKRFLFIVENWYTYEQKNTITPEETLEVIEAFIEANQDCTYSVSELAYYVKKEMNIDCVKVFDAQLAEINDEILGDCDFDDFDDFGGDDSGSIPILTDDEYYGEVFKKPSLKQQKALLELKIAILDYMKTKEYPDAYVKKTKRKK